MSPSPSTRRVASLAFVLALIGGAASCSSDPAASSKGEGPAASDATTSTSTPAATAEFTGSDADFYDPPDPLPSGEPGELIRVMTVDESGGTVTQKIMYHSRNALDEDVPVTGIVTYPSGDAPADGWPVVATSPGTVGIDAHCAISHQAHEAPGWGVEGVAVMTGYLGLGATGGPPHPYLSKPAEGHSVLDAVRAVRHLPDAHASDRWLSVGHSQGGHGALSASELSASYAPELELLGTLALSPAALLDEVYGGIDPIVTGILTVMSTYGWASEHPELDLDDYIAPEMAAASGVLETGCLDEITEALIPLAINGQLFTADPRTTPPASGFLAPNDVGTVVVDAPLFLVSGTKDDRVVIDRVRDLYRRLCDTGQVTELLIIDGADHGSIIPQTSDATAAWLNARLEGDAPTDSCAGPMPEPVPAP